MRRSARQLEIDVLATAEQAAAEVGIIGALIIHPTPENEELLLGLRDFVLTDVDPALAMSDPSLYLKKSRLRAELTIRGFRKYFEG
jgi:hypothetical protein